MTGGAVETETTAGFLVARTTSQMTNPTTAAGTQMMTSTMIPCQMLKVSMLFLL
jgi:hypothetical protein